MFQFFDLVPVADRAGERPARRRAHRPRNGERPAAALAAGRGCLRVGGKVAVWNGGARGDRPR
ncbi:hypothetical protein ABT299_52050, partial [Spirillospora sp. NPDC000708]